MKNKAELLPLLNIYSQRFGAYTMQEETMDMWWARLKDQDTDKVEEVFYELVGREEKGFGWMKILTAIDLKWPKESDQSKLDKEWQGEHKNMADKKKEASTFLRELIPEISRCRDSGKAFDWVSILSGKWLEIFGETECRRLMAKLSNEYGKTKWEGKFIDALRMDMR